MSTILGMDLTNTDDTVIPIAGSIYVKTPQALGTLLSELRVIGYTVENLRTSEKYGERRCDVATMEKNGHSLWFAHLENVQMGKCGSCNGLIKTAGIRAHGHTCELCGAVTYNSIIDGSTIRFSFICRDGEEQSMADVKLTAKRWDTAEGYLYCYPEVLDGLWLRGDRARQYLDAHKDKWEPVTEDGQQLIKMRYPNPWNYDVSAINPSEIHGHHWNHKIVKLWGGKEYPEHFGDFPLPESISIYESWHWPRHKVSPTLHSTILHACGQTDDKGWHYQDGTPWFRPGHWQNMSRYIRHFTELDADAFDRVWPGFRSDGPGGIDDLAAFCHGKPAVRNEPNIGNLLWGFGKMFREPLTEDESEAMAMAAKDPDVMADFVDLFKAGARATTDHIVSALERKIGSRKLSMSERRRYAESEGYRLIRKYRGCRERKHLVALICWNPATNDRLEIPV